MKSDLIIKQSYHGSGGKEGYKYKVLNSDYKFIGWIDNFPINHESHLFEIRGVFYTSMYEEEDNTPDGEKYEIVYIHLEKAPSIKYLHIPVSEDKGTKEIAECLLDFNKED